MSAPVLLYLHYVRTDFMAFVEQCFSTLEPGTPFRDNWHLHVIAQALLEVEAGERHRLIVNVPPRSGKSILISIAYTAWRLGRSPRLRIIVVSSDDSLVRSLASGFRAVVTSDWYRRTFPAFQIARNGNRATETITTERGYRYGVSLSGSILGRGADLIIADDAMSPAAALSEKVRRRETGFWDAAVRTRLNDKVHGAMIIVCQRLHQDDLVGHVTRGDEGA